MEAKYAIRHPTGHRTAPPEKDTAPDVSSATVEKPALQTSAIIVVVVFTFDS